MKSRIGLIFGVPLVLFALTMPASADFVINDDLIVDGSACIGFDCVNGESFGFDTLRLKENNLRIKFDDTSNSASFPKNDWTLGANDTSNGGQERFFIEDVTGGRIPFTVEAGAPSNSLYLENSGELGLGTNNPVVQLHIVDGNTPTVRLEQDGSSGFNPQTWDLAGNETNFFIRDVSNGSKLPFRIRPNVSTSAIDMFSDRIEINGGSANLDTRIESDGNADMFYVDASANKIGIGKNNPAATLDLVADTDSDSRLRLDLGASNANTGIEMVSSAIGLGSFWIKTTGDIASETFTVRGDGHVGVGVANPTNIIQVVGGANCDGAMWNNASSRELKENISNLTADEARQAVLSLNPVKYRYKQIPDELQVGFIAEDVPELVARNDRKTLQPMDIVGVLTRVIQEQQKCVETQQETIAELSQRVAALESKGNSDE